MGEHFSPHFLFYRHSRRSHFYNIVLPKLFLPLAECLSGFGKAAISSSLSYDRIPHVGMMTDHLTRRAQEDPDGVAVLWYPYVSPDETSWPFDSLTFSEWDRKANQLGRWLLDKGLQLEDRVAVCMERNTWFHIAFIGILRAGGCYVPVRRLT